MSNNKHNPLAPNHKINLPKPSNALSVTLQPRYIPTPQDPGGLCHACVECFPLKNMTPHKGAFYCTPCLEALQQAELLTDVDQETPDVDPNEQADRALPGFSLCANAGPLTPLMIQPLFESDIDAALKFGMELSGLKQEVAALHEELAVFHKKVSTLEAEARALATKEQAAANLLEEIIEKALQEAALPPEERGGLSLEGICNALSEIVRELRQVGGAK